MPKQTEYLGDGAYAANGGYEIVIYTERLGGDKHWISLEPTAMRTLLKFADETWGQDWRKQP